MRYVREPDAITAA